MSAASDEIHRKLMRKIFKMPTVQTMMARKSTITNAYVIAVLPKIIPTHQDIDETLRVLQLDPNNLTCSYCGDPCTEWDHLRPLVVKRRPTGFISEIGNLVVAKS